MEDTKGPVLLSDTSCANGGVQYTDWGKIYRIFANEKYSKNDEDYEVFAKVK